jgi:hypothetical protein
MLRWSDPGSSQGNSCLTPEPKAEFMLKSYSAKSLSSGFRSDPGPREVSVLDVNNSAPTD